MPHAYPHLMSRIFGVPLMIDPGKAQAIVQGLSDRIGVAPMPAAPLHVEGVPLPQAWGPKRTVANTIRNEKPYLTTRSGIAIIVADGTLAHAAAGAYPPSGITAYSDLRAELEDAAADPQIRGILLDVNSPGGEASDSAFALAAYIREIRNIKPVWAQADEMALSAGYLFASAASRLMVPALGYAGSIGVYALHLDQSGFDTKQGLTWTYIKAGAHKTDGNHHEPLKGEARERLQADVNMTYERFVAEVGRSRPGLGAKRARETEARYYLGAEGVRLGLADAAQDFNETLAEFEALVAKAAAASSAVLMMAAGPLTPSAAAPASASANQDRPMAVAAAPSVEETTMPPVNSETPATEQPKAAAAPAAVAASDASVPAADPAPPSAAPGAAPAVAAAAPVAGRDPVAEERARCSEINALCRLARQSNRAQGFIDNGSTIAQVREALGNAPAAGAEIDALAAPIAGGAGGAVATGLDVAKVYGDMNKPRQV